MTDSVSRSIKKLGDAGVRSWRIVTVLGFVTAAVTTHWPKLVFGPEAPSDKILHAVTFGLLTFLLWHTRWIKSVWILLLVMLAYAAVDEWTQSLPWFQRHTSLNDWIADQVGIALVCFLIFLKPKPKNPVMRMRAALADAAEREMFSRPFTWAALATSAALGALVGIPLTVAVGKFVFRDQHPWQTAFLGGFFFAAVGIELTWRSALRAAVLRVARERRCFCCGERIALDGSADTSACKACGEQWRHAQWIAPVVTRRGADLFRWRAYAPGALFGGIGIMLVFFLVLISILLARPDDPLPQDMRGVFLYAFGIAWMGVVPRFMAAPVLRLLEKEGTTCIACGHDLRGTSAAREVGRCPECGNEFVRIEIE